jgi:hypothetical protein
VLVDDVVPGTDSAEEHAEEAATCCGPAEPGPAASA